MRASALVTYHAMAYTTYMGVGEKNVVNAISYYAYIRCYRLLYAWAITGSHNIVQYNSIRNFISNYPRREPRMAPDVCNNWITHFKELINILTTNGGGSLTLKVKLNNGGPGGLLRWPSDLGACSKRRGQSISPMHMQSSAMQHLAHAINAYTGVHCTAQPVVSRVHIIESQQLPYKDLVAGKELNNIVK